MFDDFARVGALLDVRPYTVAEAKRSLLSASACPDLRRAEEARQGLQLSSDSQTGLEPGAG